MPITIQQDNPQNCLLKELATQNGFVWEVMTTYDEAIWRHLLEEDLLQRLQLEGRALALSSPQAALWIAFLLSKIDKEDVVLYPLNAPWYGAYTIQAIGAKPFLVDIDNDALDISAKGVKEAILEIRNERGNRPKAIVVNDFCGLPSDIGALEVIAAEEGLTIIENASEAYLSERTGSPGGVLHGYRILPIGEYAVGTAATGVLLVCPNEERCQRARQLASRDTREPMAQSAFPLGAPLLISSAQLLHGYSEFLHAEEKKARRREAYLRYRRNLKKILGLDFFSLEGKAYSYNYMRILLSVDHSLLHFSKEELLVRLRDGGIGALPLTLPLHRTRDFRQTPTYFNGLSEAWYNNTLLLPSGSGIQEREIDHICEVIGDTVRHYN